MYGAGSYGWQRKAGAGMLGVGQQVRALTCCVAVTARQTDPSLPQEAGGKPALAAPEPEPEG